MKPSFHIATFGCKVNQYDSQLMREKLLAAGYEEKARGAEPDIVIVNTCTVTSTADAKARRLIRRIAREAPRCKIVVAGCMVDRDREQFAGLLGVWKVINNEQKPDIADIVATEAMAEGVRLSGQANTFRRAEAISDFAGHTRAFVKVQDGCDAWCAYCIVPSVRGSPRSRPMDEALDEIRGLAGRFKEIVLTGVHVGLYHDACGADLLALIRKVLDETPVERLRLTSIEVAELSPELLDLAGHSPRFCPHFHVPLQSGSDRVLERMRRRYASGHFLAAIDRIRERLNRPSVTTDVIVGFPGETDEDFEETLEVCRAAGFSRTHIFPYSDRPGTAAAEMRNKCPASVITARKKALEELASQLALAYKEQFVGETVNVLAENSRDRSGKLCGYTDRYLRVLFDGDDELGNNIVPVHITAAEPDTLFGELEGAH